MQWVNSVNSEMVDTNEVIHWRRSKSVYSGSETLLLTLRGGIQVTIEFEADDLYNKLTSKREIL